MSKKRTQKYKDWMKHVYNIQEDYEFGPLEEFKNEEGRLHRDNAPAYISPTRLIHYQNGRRHGLLIDKWGTKIYFFEDVCIPSFFIEEPEKLELEFLLKHRNSEVRAVGLRIYGFERLLREEKLKVVDIDKKKNRMLLRWDAKDPEESFSLVRVLNGTAEPDGTFSVYFLVVPPTMKTCQEAVAWTFYKEADTYVPTQET